MRKIIILMFLGINLINLAAKETLVNKLNYEYIVDISVGKPLLNIEGLKYEEEENYHLAEKYFKMAVDGGDIVALNNLANIYSLQKNYTLAEKFYKLAIENNVNLALKNLSLMYLEIEKYDLSNKYKKLYEEKQKRN